MAKFEIQKKSAGVVLSIEGRLTMDDKSVFESYVQPQIADGSGNFGIDLTQLDDVDSAGIGDLIKLKMQAAKIYNGVYVFGIEGDVERVFRVSGLNSVFTVISAEEFAAL